MAGRPKFYRCGACHTKNVYVKALGVPYGQEGWLLIMSVNCRHCRAGRSRRAGLDPWQGEQVEAALLSPEDRPTLAAQRRAVERLGDLLSGTPEALAEQERIKAALQPFPIPNRLSLRLLKGGKQ
jgi:hypothetical protein